MMARLREACLSESLLYLVAGALIAIPGGILTNYLFEKWYRPSARVELGADGMLGQIGGTALGRLLGPKNLKTVDVITDGRFIDTAVFLFSAMEGANNAPPTRIRLRQVDWASVPYETAKASAAISYMNRRAVPDVGENVRLWSNLCAFHGYALIGRPKDFPSPPASLAEANAALEALAAKRKLRIITFGSDSIDVLRTPLTPTLNSDRVTMESLPVEHALNRFLGGHGDLFIGGLPQRLSCVKQGLVEVVTSQMNPLMLGIDSLPYNGDVDVEVLQAISASWSRVCRELAASEDYAREVFKKWSKIAQALQIAPMYGEDEFILATHFEAGKYLKFFAGRDDAASDLIRATKIIVREANTLHLGHDATWAVIEALHDVYDGAPAERLS